MVRTIIADRHALRDASLAGLADRVARGASGLRVQGVSGSARALLAAVLFRRLGKPLVVVTPTEGEARGLHRDMVFFLGEDAALLYPEGETVATDILTAQTESERDRIHVLDRLLDGAPVSVVTSLPALLRKVLPRDVLRAGRITVSMGDTADRDGLARRLLAGGYERVTLVAEAGEFSLRGHILDVFPPGARHPVRLEFVGDEIESLRTFDAASQRSIEEVVSCTLVPAREAILTEERIGRAIRNVRRRAQTLELPRPVRESLSDAIADGLTAQLPARLLPLFYENLPGTEDPTAAEGLGTLFDYLPAEALFVLDNPAALRQAQEEFANELDGLILKAEREGRFFLEREQTHLSGSEGWAAIQARPHLRVGGLTMTGGDAHPAEGGAAAETAVTLSTERETTRLEGGRVSVAEEGLLKPLAERIRQWIASGHRVLFVCAGPESRDRIGHLLAQYDLPATREEAFSLDDIVSQRGRGRLGLVEGRLTGGFHWPGLKLAVISEEEIFGRKHSRRRPRPVREGYFLKSFGELNEGDPVVHTDHGIGIYRGLTKLAVGKIENDFLLIEYQEGDKLYLPVDRLDRIQRYIGSDGHDPRLDRLGGQSWEALKSRVKKSIQEVAEELVSIYAAREVMERENFSPPDRSYEEFASAFPFTETPDQVRAIEDVHLDMNAPKPMDRLICGDAGFGKTEVALRASFRAVMDGRQVAVLVPTTILAEQHYQTFLERFRDYPVQVACLNRFRSRVQQTEIVAGTHRGTVDIVIGTHRLLQKDVAFKNLGLVIIDEEQRFGVLHKEKLKKLRTLVDVLTLTATPIPRTLHLSLVGIRDLSIINSPPEDRQPIRTYLAEFDEDMIQKAVRQELLRGGQVFFLHDRVRSLNTMARLVEKLVPEARVEVVHGQMKSTDIERRMAAFVRRDFDVLVCTTIIGAGLDIPTANTMIINRADRFGLAQLYQIRGRVGRARDEAYAYLFVPRGALLSPEARRRLEVILEFTEPGSGFRIAAGDLDIRGAGNLLGMSQSGHIAAVGYELYTELMEKTIREIKGETLPEERVRPEIHLGVPAYIPSDYMSDEHQRLVTYKRISLAADEDALAEIRAELLDCYGFIPGEVDNLLEVIRIRNALTDLKGRKMGYDEKQLFIHFSPDSPVDPVRISGLAKLMNLPPPREKPVRTLVRTLRKPAAARETPPGVRLTPDYRLYVPLPGLKGDGVLAGARRLIDALGAGKPDA